MLGLARFWKQNGGKPEITSPAAFASPLPWLSAWLGFENNPEQPLGQAKPSSFDIGDNKPSCFWLPSPLALGLARFWTQSRAKPSCFDRLSAWLGFEHNPEPPRCFDRLSAWLSFEHNPELASRPSQAKLLAPGPFLNTITSPAALIGSLGLARFWKQSRAFQLLR